ncbi:HNH endonuclease [Chryseobacterium binzhouense]|uniref:HNH endonuclease n=1 Tax=Chryseobacterium binzhouense TaxID=2593646 RepID=UPI00117D3D7E|nr:HNH endonuclease [Chryseobacterium binzhouense]
MLKINPTQEALDFHYEKVSKIFDKIINRDIGNGLLEDTTIKFIKGYKNILIKGKPELLLKVHQKFNRIITNQDFENLKTCFNRAYENQLQKKHGKEFLEKLKIDTCIYCNRNYTLYFDGNFARAELDHWFPKEKFPLLALSFYNLIPSCHSCNHKKGNGDKIIKSKFLYNENATNIEIQNWWNNKALTKLIHPYSNKIDFNFSYNVEGINTYSSKIKVQKDSISEETLKFNKTKEIYSAHSNKELKDLLDLRYKYSKNYLDILCNKTFEGLNLSQEEAYRMIFGIEINEEDYHKRPFSKFKHDIIEELKKSF